MISRKIYGVLVFVVLLTLSIVLMTDNQSEPSPVEPVAEKVEPRRVTPPRSDYDRRLDETMESYSQIIAENGWVPVQYSRECPKIPAGHLEKIKQSLKVFGATDLNNREGSIMTGEQAYRRFSLIFGYLDKSRYLHSHYDDGEMIYLWIGHEDLPAHGYAVNKKDRSTFGWAIAGAPEEILKRHNKAHEIRCEYFMDYTHEATVSRIREKLNENVDLSGFTRDDE